MKQYRFDYDLFGPAYLFLGRALCRGRPELWRHICLRLCLALAAVLAPACVLASPFQNDFAFSQTQFENIGDAESISEGVVTALAQDARGFIWIGTQVGLVRYDGYNFRKFSHGASDPFSLAGDHIASLMVARDGRLWVGTNSAGLSVFDPGSERFENFAHDAKRPNSLSGGRIWAIAEDAKGAWLATDRGLDYLPSNGKDFRHYRHDAANPASLLNDKVRSLLHDRAGRLWVGGVGGLQRLSENGKGFEPMAGDGFTDKSIQTLFQAQDGKLWVGTEQHGAAWLDGGAASADALKPHWLELDPANGGALSHAWVNGIVQMQADQIWLATYGGGINIVAAGDGKVLQQLHHDPALPSSLALDAVLPMLLDRAGLLWVGTWGGGLQRFNRKNNIVRLLRHSASLPSGLSSRNVHSVLELANGQILFGTDDNGIDIFDRTRGLVGGYRATKGQAGALPDAAIHALAQTADGSLWAGTRQAGLLRLPQGGQMWQPVSGLPDLQVRKILESRDGNLWVATGLGVARLKKGQPRPLGGKTPTAQFEAVPDEHGKPMQSVVYTLAEDRQGRIWAGTDNGLWVLAPGAKGWQGINKDAGTVIGPFSDLIFGLLIDGHDRLWLSTDQGLFRLQRWDGKTAQFEHISAQIGQTGKALGDNLLEDKAGRIWAESALIDPATMQMVPLTKADGFDYGSNWAGAHHKTRDGLLLFGGTQGVAVIDPALFQPWTYMPPVVITELKINGQTVPLGASALLPETAQPGLTLTHDQHDFALEFAALDFSDPQKNRYQYRLQGYDKDWIVSDFKHRSVTYGNLRPGNYALQVRGSNRLGQWSTHELTIPIRILPIWHQTWWCHLAETVLALLAVIGLVQGRTGYLRRAKRALEVEVSKRTSELMAANDSLYHANTELALSATTLRELDNVGRQIARNLDMEAVFEALYAHVSALLNATCLAIYRVGDERDTLERCFAREDGVTLPNVIIALDSTISNAALVARERRELLLEFSPDDEASPSHVPGTRQMLTLLFAPLIVDQRLLGVLSIQSHRQQAFRERERMIFLTLCSYGAIAFDNASAYLQLQQAQTQLVAQEKLAALGALVGGVAHELNTPLGNCLMMTSMVQDNTKGLAAKVEQNGLRRDDLVNYLVDTRDACEVIMRGLNSAAGLVTSFKQVAVDRSVARREKFDLLEISGEAIDSMTGQIGDGHRIELSIAPGIAMDSYPGAYGQVLKSLLENALIHGLAGRQQGRILLSARPNPAANRVVVTLHDNGAGIAPEHLKHIFDPFFTTAMGQGGKGLGLSICYNIVTSLLCGRISAASAVGDGTTLTLDLPLSAE